MVHKIIDAPRLNGRPCSFALGSAGCLGLGAQFGHGQPVVLVRLIGDPRRQRHAQIAAQCLGVALVERAHVAQPLDGVPVAANADAALAEQVVELLIALGRKPVGSIVDRARARKSATGPPSRGAPWQRSAAPGALRVRARRQSASAEVSRMAVSALIQLWLLCCERK